jgi:subfamily B ATP-binding cassette protein MsbA
MDKKSDIYNSWLIVKRYIRPHISVMLLSLLLMAVVAGATSCYAYLLKVVLDKIFVAKDTVLITLIPFVIAAVSLVKNTAYYFQSSLMSIAFEKISTKMRQDLFKRFIYSDIQEFHDKPSSHMISNIIYDIDAISGGLNTILTICVREVLTVIFLLSILLYQNPTLTLLSLTSFPLTLGPMVLISRKVKDIGRKNQVGLEKFISAMDESLKSPKLVKSFNAEQFEVAKMNLTLRTLLNFKKRMIRITRIGAPLNEFLGISGVALVIWYGGWQVIKGHSTVGDFFSFFISMTLAYRPLKSISGLNLTIQGFLINSTRFISQIYSQPTIKSKKDAIVLHSVKGKIEFKDVIFKYDGLENNTLDGISFLVNPGKMIALVGPTGAGKSTILSLLLRFYDVNYGSINLEDSDIRDLHLDTLRNSISYVSQEVQLLDDTLENNIKYIKVDALESEVIKAAKMANAWEFIEKLPNGLQTQIGQSGVKLSGGQRQRIAIARAILYDAPILLLDEATSALDSISEKLIQESLSKFMKNRTTIAIAHRLSTIMHADEILVVDNGTIVEKGTHKSLIEKNGHYSRLYKTQFAITEPT